MSPATPPGDGFAILVLVPPPQADHDLPLRLVGEFRGLEAEPGTERVDADRLLHEDVLARLDGGVEVEGAEARGRGEDDEVDVRQVEEPLGGVEAGEPSILGAVDLVLHALHAFECAVDAVLKRVGDRRELDVRPGHGERLLEGPGPATTGPDQPDLDRVAGGVLGVDSAQGRQRGGAGGDRLQGITAGERERRHAEGSGRCGIQNATRGQDTRWAQPGESADGGAGGGRQRKKHSRGRITRPRLAC